MRYDLFDRGLERIKRNADIVKNGLSIGIPYPFPRLNDKLFGIQKGNVELVTAVSGLAKSKYTRFVYIYNVYRYYLMNKNYNVRILYFPLEDGENVILYHLICYHLYEVYGVQVSIHDILSKSSLISPKVLDLIEKSRDYFGQLFDILYIYDSITTPTEIFKTVYSWACLWGSEVKDEAGNFQRFLINDNAPHLIAIVDNLSNITPERGVHGDQHAAIGDLMREKFRKILAKHCEVTCVVDAQQSADKEKHQYDQNGKTVISKLVPSIDGLATNKEIIREAHVAFGLFSPSRYQIPLYKGYKIEQLGNYFRSLLVLKNNEGETDFELPLYFDGKIEYFKQAPSTNPEDAEALEKLYLHVIKRQQADAIARRESELFK